MSSITLTHLTKRFGGFTALSELDLNIGDREFVALLGPSGCGKSTTMNLIAGMMNPSEGSIRFGERDVTDVAMGQRGVGFVFQNYAIFTHMTVRENLAFGLRMRRLPRAERDRKVAGIADLLHLGPLLDRPARGLSVNILQRLAIGRSAIVEPAIFLLDEPLSNVDAAFRAVMRTELRSLQRQLAQTMVYVTHDQLEAMTMADRIAVMDQGVLQQIGGPLEVYNNPRNVFVARFIGSPGMNILSGQLLENDGRIGVALDGIGWTPLRDPALAATARRAASDAVLLGVRPEDLLIEADDGSDFRMPVVFVERIGARTIVHLEAGAQSGRAILDESLPPATGSMVGLRVNAARLRLFDRASGRALAQE
jgi:multiple sugar transport system ATP-binding protein